VQIFDPPPAPRAPRRRSWRVPRIRPPGWLRRPLTWVIATEAAVTLAFVVAALHLLARSVAAAGATAPAQPAPLPAPSSVATAPGVAVAPAVAVATSPKPHPGLGQDSAFLGGLLSGLNHDQASYEHAQWSALQALSGAIRTYIEDVVLPAVERATRSARSP
jgi:hypothetical protein